MILFYYYANFIILCKPSQIVMLSTELIKYLSMQIKIFSPLLLETYLE